MRYVQQRLETAMTDAHWPYRTMATSELAILIAKLYDERADYRLPWEALVYRVGQDDAERMVDQA